MCLDNELVSNHTFPLHALTSMNKHEYKIDGAAEADGGPVAGNSGKNVSDFQKPNPLLY